MGVKVKGTRGCLVLKDSFASWFNCSHWRQDSWNDSEGSHRGDTFQTQVVVGWLVFVHFSLKICVLFACKYIKGN